MTTYTLNQEHHGIEITFGDKPAANIRDSLKASGFRWHRTKGFWYAKQTPERLALAEKIANGGEVNTTKKAPEKGKAEVVNAYGVKVGDFFSTSWGYEQTNNDFFQVVALVGKTSVRVREVNPPLISSEAVSGMSEDRVYKLDSAEILPPAQHSTFIKDQNNGDLKRLKSYAADGKSNPQFYLASFADAHYCPAGSVKVYESWYY